MQNKFLKKIILSKNPPNYFNSEVRFLYYNFYFVVQIY